MADESTPTDSTQVQSRDDSALTSAPVEALQSVAQVLPPTPVAPPAPAPSAPAVAAPVTAPRTPAELVASVASVAPPIVKSTTNVVEGRKKENTDKQIATYQAATDTLAGSMAANAQSEDQRAVAAVDKRIAARQAQQDEANARAAQAVADKKAADERTKQLMDLPDGQIDPDRFVNSLSTGSKIGLTVLAAISGFANGMRNAGGPNSQGGPPDLSVLNVLTKRIDEDIASQKDQLAQGRLRKSNLIARAEAQGADAKQAESIARAQLWNLSADIGDLQAQRVGLDGANLAAAQKQTAAMRYQSSIHEGEIRAQEEAKISRSRETETGKPVAGKGNPDAQNKAWKNYYDAIDGGSDRTTAYRESGLASMGVSQPTGASKEDRAAAEKSAEQQTKAGERTEDQAKMAGVMTAAAEYARARGFVRGPDGWAPGGKRGTEAQRVAARTAYETALKAGGYDKDAVKEATKEPGGVGSAILDAVPFGFLFSSDTTPEDAAAQLNAFENTTQQRLSQRDRVAPKAGTVPSAWK